MSSVVGRPKNSNEQGPWPKAGDSVHVAYHKGDPDDPHQMGDYVTVQELHAYGLAGKKLTAGGGGYDVFIPWNRIRELR